jgi:hypothetical protein
MRKWIVSLALVLGCVASWAGEPMPDFKMPDVNPNSVRHDSPVSPRDYLQQVSGYYFGESG